MIKKQVCFYTSNEDEELITRSKEVNDHVIPSSNSVMANNLLKLGHYFLKQEYIDISQQMLKNLKDQLIKIHISWLTGLI